MPLQQSRVRHADDIHKNIKQKKQKTKKREKISMRQIELEEMCWSKRWPSLCPCNKIRHAHTSVENMHALTVTWSMFMKDCRWFGCCTCPYLELLPQISFSVIFMGECSKIFMYMEWVKVFHITHSQLSRMSSSDPHNIWSVICTSTWQEAKIDMKSNSWVKITNCFLKCPFACFIIEFAGINSKEGF